MTEKPSYYDDLVTYLCDPYDNRTLDDFAKSVGVSVMTLWRVRKSFEDDLQREIEVRRHRIISQMRNAAYKSLLARLKHDTQALRLFFQLAGDLIERTETTNYNVTPEEKRQRIEQLTQRLANMASNKKTSKDKDKSVATEAEGGGEGRG